MVYGRQKIEPRFQRWTMRKKRLKFQLVGLAMEDMV